MHHALDDLQHRSRIWTVLLLTVPERPDRQRHGSVRPLSRAALITVGDGVAGADLGQELNLVGEPRRRLGEGTTNVDAGVVVGTADGGAAVRLDVDEGGQVQLLGTGAVARLPDREQLREAPAVTRRERRLDREERMREGRRDLTIVEVLRARLDAVSCAPACPLVILGRDPVTEHVHSSVARPSNQTVGSSDTNTPGRWRDLQSAGDRVVVGDRHEIHSTPLGELIDLRGLGGALGQVKRTLDPQLRQLGCRRVHVHVGAAHVQVGAADVQFCALGLLHGASLLA